MHKIINFKLNHKIVVCILFYHKKKIFKLILFMKKNYLNINKMIIFIKYIHD